MIVKDKIKSEGYLGINLTGFSIEKLNGIKLFRNKYFSELSKKIIIPEENKKLSLDEVKSLSKEIFTSYFDIDDILFLEKNRYDELTKLSDIEVASLLKKYVKTVSPFDIDIILKDQDNMFGQVAMIINPTNNGERIIFTHINLSNRLNGISPIPYTHEIAHVCQEKNIGYATDKLDRDIIPIFVEKLMALELDKTGTLLKAYERMRLRNIIGLYTELCFDKSISENKRNLYYQYIKSTLVATKLFDMYLNENNKDSYIDSINNIFKGKQTVEDYIASKRITLSQCQDLSLLKRHM